MGKKNSPRKLYERKQNAISVQYLFQVFWFFRKTCVFYLPWLWRAPPGFRHFFHEEFGNTLRSQNYLIGIIDFDHIVVAFDLLYFVEQDLIEVSRLVQIVLGDVVLVPQVQSFIAEKEREIRRRIQLAKWREPNKPDSTFYHFMLAAKMRQEKNAEFSNINEAVD